jgi:hypothetical protein
MFGVRLFCGRELGSVLTQIQLELALGTVGTILPEVLQPPVVWSKSSEEHDKYLLGG